MLHHFMALTVCQYGYCGDSAAGDSGGTVALALEKQSVKCQLRINNAGYQNNEEQGSGVQCWKKSVPLPAPFSKCDTTEEHIICSNLMKVITTNPSNDVPVLM